MPRKSKTYHYIYKTTCLMTGRFYVGMHSTDNLEDGYLGSGKRLGHSRKKYGDDQHIKVILEMLPTREALKLREKELVNSEMLMNSLCMNLQEGGGGGFAGESHRQAFINSSRTAHLRGTEKARQIASKSLETRKQRGTIVFPHFDWTGRKHSDETISKQSIAMKGRYDGENNPSFGTCWVTNGSAIKINKEQLDEYLSNGYKRGRKYSV